MKVNLPNTNLLNQINPQKVTEEPKNKGFARILTDALNQASEKQQKADEITKQFVAGEVDDLHQVMIAVEEANLSMQFMVQVRNKIIEAYQEIARMQI